LNKPSTDVSQTKSRPVFPQVLNFQILKIAEKKFENFFILKIGVCKTHSVLVTTKIFWMIKHSPLAQSSVCKYSRNAIHDKKSTQALFLFPYVFNKNGLIASGVSSFSSTSLSSAFIVKSIKLDSNSA
jgi:hypothetical protein